MKLDNETGDYMLTMCDIDYTYDYPYGVGTSNLTLRQEMIYCLSVVRAALKRAKANL